MSDETFPDQLRIRDTCLHDDMGGAGQRIYTTAGQGYKKVLYVRADLYDALRAEVATGRALAMEAYNRIVALEAQLSARDADVDQLKKDLVRQMAWKTEAQDERDALSDVLNRNGFVPCDIAACNCGSWHARYGLSERWDELRDDLADAGHPLCNENGNLMRNALASLVAERDLFRRETVALAKDAMKVDADVRALRWRDVADELPNEAQEVLIVHNGKTLHGAWIGGRFWHSNQPHVAAYWMPLPQPIVGPTLASALLTGEPGPGGDQ